MRFLFGLLLLVIGFFLIWKTNWMMNSLGRIAWAEAKLGSTWTFYKLLGAVLILAAFIIMTGLFTGILDFIFVR